MESSVLNKSMVLLEYLAGSGEQTLGTIAAGVGQTRPTAHRILSSLVSLGFVDRKHDGVYGLTGKLRRIAMGGGDAKLVEAARLPLVRLRARTNETVNLGVLRGTRVHYLSTLASDYPLRRQITPGESDPFFCTALGRVIAAYIPEPKVLGMLRDTDLVARSKQTVTDPKKLMALIRRAGIEGFSVEHDQTDIGVSCVAAPVRAGRDVVAAISISGVQARMAGQSIDALVRLVRRAADQASEQLGREFQP